jgi:hypothetical protein
MAALEVIALDTATPQLRAPGASDTYTFPRAVEMPLGTANGVLYLNGSKVATSGSALTFDGANFKVTVPTGTPNTDGFSIKLQDVGGSTNDVGFGVDGSGNLWQNVAASGPGFISYIGGSEQMRLTSTGLGIGTTNPSATLELARTSADVGLFITRSSTGAASYRQFIDGDGDIRFNMVSSKSIRFFTNNTERARIPAAGGMVVGTAALATSATDGFLYVPTCAGTPTGTPTTQTGTAPIVVDTTNNKLYFYSGGQWRDAGP